MAHTITAGATNGLIVAANYAELSQITLNSSVTGMAFTVDGTSCPTPCSVSKANGSTSTVSVPPSVPFAPGSRYDFTGWSDGITSTTRTITYTQNSLALTANYTTSYQLTTASNPAPGGTFALSPGTSDGYFLSGTQVHVTAVAALGYKFAHWTGALAGGINSGSVQMNGPQTVVADYATVPYISPAGIQSATGPTVDGSVAAGSIISIYGQSLAPTFMLGTTPQLAQTVNGTAVTVGSFILPLVYVSPTLISAQVPWELGPGTYTLTVNTQGQDPIPGQFTVSRYSPGHLHSSRSIAAAAGAGAAPGRIAGDCSRVSGDSRRADQHLWDRLRPLRSTGHGRIPGEWSANGHPDGCAGVEWRDRSHSNRLGRSG